MKARNRNILTEGEPVSITKNPTEACSPCPECWWFILNVLFVHLTYGNQLHVWHLKISLSELARE